MNLENNSQFGQYRILRLLGRGGMGEVYEVQHLTLGRAYALKLLPPEFAKHTDALARFRREARVMANLEHPHIVRVDDFGETEGRYWLRMELVKGVRIAECGVGNGRSADIPVGPGEGGARKADKNVGAPVHCVTLGEYAAGRGGRIEQGEFAVMLKQILEALAYAHEAGVVHRDLKPGNILLDEDANGRVAVRVADFGLARVVGDEFLRSQAQLNVSRNVSLGQAATLAVEAGRGAVAGSEEEGTSTRALVGTWEYMSPEQKRGEEADARSDVYAVGLMCYRLLTGKGLGLKLPSELVPGVDPEWDRFVTGAVEQDPAARYTNGREMLAAAAPLLERVQGRAEQRTAEDQQRAEAEAAQRALEQEQRAAAEAAQAREAEERRLRAAREQERRKQLERLRAEAQYRNEERMDRVALQWAKLRLLPWSWVVLGLAVLAFALTIWRASPPLWPAVLMMLLGVIAARVTCGPKWPAGVAAALGLVMAAAAVYPRFAQRGFHSAKSGQPARSQPTAGPAGSAARSAGSPARLVSSSRWHLSFRSRRYDRSMVDCSDLVFVPGGRYLAIATDMSIELWDPERPVLYRTLPDWRGRSGSVSMGERGHYRHLSAASGGTLLACALGSSSSTMDAGLIDLRTGEIVRTFARDEKETEVVGLALSPDGQHLACTYKGYSGGSGYIKLWNARTGEFRRYLGAVAQASAGQSLPPPVVAPPPPPATAFAERYGVSSRTASSAYRRKSASPSPPRAVTYSSESVKEEAVALAFAPDGKTLACSYKISSGGGLIRLWNVEDGKAVRQTYTLPVQGGGNEFQRRYGLSGVGGGDEWVVALRYAPDGTTLACGYANCGSQARFAEVRLWDTAQPNSKPIPVLRSSQAGAHTEVLPNALDISPDGKYLACSFKRAGAPWEVRVFDLRMNTPLATLTDATGDLTQSSPKSVSGIAFSPDGGSLAIGLTQDYGQSATLFEFRETRTGKVLRQVAKHDLNRSSGVRALAVSPDGLTLACGFSGPASRAEIILTQPGSGSQPRQVPDASSNPAGFNRLEFNSALAFVPGSAKLVAGYEGPDSDGALKIWDPATGTLDRTLSCPAGGDGKESNRWSVVSLSVAPDGKSLVCLCRDLESRLEARLWDLEKDALASRTPLDVFPAGALVFTGFSASGQPRCCAYGGAGAAGRLTLADPKTGKVEQTIETAPGEYEAAWVATAAALAPDGITLACAYAKTGEHSGLQPLVLWDASAKELRKVAEENIYSSEGSATALCFYDKGASIACGAGDGDIKQWDIKPTGSGAARR